MKSINKIMLAALLIPSSMIVGEPTIQKESIIGNLQDSIGGFQEGFYKTTLGFSRLILDLSKNAGAAGNYFAEHYWVLGGVTAATAGAFGYLYYKRPKVTLVNNMGNFFYQMYYNGRNWFSQTNQPAPQH